MEEWLPGRLAARALGRIPHSEQDLTPMGQALVGILLMTVLLFAVVAGVARVTLGK